MPRQAAPASAGALEATNEDELKHWRSLRTSVAASGRQSGSEGPHSPAHADFDCAGTALARAGTGKSAGVTAEESARDGRGDAEARSGSALWNSLGCCSRARALSCTPTERASQCRSPFPFRRTSTCTAFIRYLVGILFLSLLAAPPARAGADAYVKAFPRTRTRRWFSMLAIFQSTLAAPGERNSPERRGRPPGLLWSSLAFEPRILHAPISLKVAFRMPIPLARDEMVIFSLPGFRRDGGSGFLSGGPAVDDDYRFVRVPRQRASIGVHACSARASHHSCSVLLMFDSRSVRSVGGVMSHRVRVLQGVLEFVRRKNILYRQGHSSARGNSLPGTGPFSWHLHSEGRSHRKQQPAGNFNQRRGRRFARHSLSVCGHSSDVFTGRVVYGWAPILFHSTSGCGSKRH